MKPKKCKVCKNEFKPSKPLQVVCSWVCGQKYAQKLRDKKQAQEKKESKERLKKMSIDAHSQKHKNTLQNEINKLARMIDLHCGNISCIDCGKELEQNKQIDGSHFHNVQGNEQIRFNLHNIHSSRSECNQFYGGKKDGYKEGIIQRYGYEYLDQMENLKTDFKMLKLQNKEIFEAIPVVRKLQRDLPTFTSKDGIFLRNFFNKIIGFY
jgi:hypothetical protein